MVKKGKLFFVAEVAAAALLVSTQVTFAAPKGYIDPGTGGMLFQVLAVIITMASGFVFLFSNKIKMFFKRGKQESDTIEETPMLLTQLDGLSDEEKEETGAAPATK